MTLNGFGHVLDRGKSASHGSGQPLLPSFGRPGVTHIIPQILGGFFAGPRPGSFQRAELFPMFLRHMFPLDVLASSKD